MHPDDRRRRRLARRCRQPGARSAARRHGQPRSARATLSFLAAALLRGAGVWRVAPNPASPDRAVGRRLRRLVRRRARADARVPPARSSRRWRAPGWLCIRPLRSGSFLLSWAIALYVVVAVGGSAYSGVIQRFIVGPNEQVREIPYIAEQHPARRARRSRSTRSKNGRCRATRGCRGPTSSAMPRRSRTCPLWNDQQLLDTFGQIQEIRTYYDFASVDNDRYIIDGKYRQIMLSARELNSRSLPSRTWINEQLTFTHGYGLTLGPVNEVTPEGLPVLFIRDLPLTSSVDLKVTQPAIYFGELPGDGRLRQDEDRRVRLSARRGQRFCHLSGPGRRAARRPVPAADVRHPFPFDGHVLLADADAREPRDDAPPHQRARRRASRRS